ncbi:hypothetical protein ASF64_12175 [Arthrobacter sp. Leaf137]|nr:hypothetical protein ASF64_12175 [Arthrobacter sp. Leaf137]
MFHDVDILQRMHRTTAGVRKPIGLRTSLYDSLCLGDFFAARRYHQKLKPNRPRFMTWIIQYQTVAREPSASTAYRLLANHITATRPIITAPSLVG